MSITRTLTTVAAATVLVGGIGLAYAQTATDTTTMPSSTTTTTTPSSTTTTSTPSSDATTTSTVAAPAERPAKADRG